MQKSNQLSIFEEVEKQKVREKIKIFEKDDFVEEMDKIKALPEKEWLILFGAENN